MEVWEPNKASKFRPLAAEVSKASRQEFGDVLVAVSHRCQPTVIWDLELPYRVQSHITR